MANLQDSKTLTGNFFNTCELKQNLLMSNQRKENFLIADIERLKTNLCCVGQFSVVDRIVMETELKITQDKLQQTKAEFTGHYSYSIDRNMQPLLRNNSRVSILLSSFAENALTHSYYQINKITAHKNQTVTFLLDIGRKVTIHNSQMVFLKKGK
jgi:hypothetical protein